jgi:hypothetical protein
MLVVTHGRSGATRYCMDMSEKTGLPFVGEMSPANIESNPYAKVKSESHETGYQPTYTPDEFYDLVFDNADKIVQANRSAVGLIPYADVVLLRRDLKQSLMSFAKLLSHPSAQCDEKQILLYCKMLFDDYLGLVTVCDVANHRGASLDLLWFEDLYPSHKQDVSIVSTSAPSASQFFDYLISQTNITDTVNNLYGD